MSEFTSGEAQGILWNIVVVSSKVATMLQEMFGFDIPSTADVLLADRLKIMGKAICRILDSRLRTDSTNLIAQAEASLCRGRVKDLRTTLAQKAEELKHFWYSNFELVQDHKDV